MVPLQNILGWALNNSILNKDPIPAHRVVNRIGLLTGKSHFPGDTMIRLLESEGIPIIEDKIQDFKTYFWDPEDHLNMF